MSFWVVTFGIGSFAANIATLACVALMLYAFRKYM